MIALTTFALGIFVGLLVSKKGININITHKQDVDKSSHTDDYNRSVGDRDTVTFLDRQYGGDE